MSGMQMSSLSDHSSDQERLIDASGGGDAVGGDGKEQRSVSSSSLLPSSPSPTKHSLPCAVTCVFIALLFALAAMAVRILGHAVSEAENDSDDFTLEYKTPSPFRQGSARVKSTIELHWTATSQLADFDGVTVSSIGVSGSHGHEAPIIINKGDTILLHFTNSLSTPTSLHFHGIFQNRTGFMDGPTFVTQCPIPPGASYLYNFTVDNQAGTYFWHAHYGLQSIDGLRGPFIINDPEEQRYMPKYDADYTIQLSDWYHEPSQYLSDWYLNSETNPDGNEPVFQSGLMNGIGQYNCSAVPDLACKLKAPFIRTVTPGSTNRLRVMNTGSFAAFLFSIDGHALTVVEVDGVTVEPYVVDMVPLNVAQRYSVIVKAINKPGNYKMRAQIYHGDTWTSMPTMPPGFISQVTGLLHYEGSDPAAPPLSDRTRSSSPRILDDMELAPYPATAVPPQTDRILLFDFDFETLPGDRYQKAYTTLSTLSPEAARWDLLFKTSFSPPRDSGTPMLVHARTKGRAWQPRTDSAALFLSRGEVIDLVIRNDDPGEHPFHIHGHDFWVLASGVANSTAALPRRYTNPNPLRRDVVTVAACPHDVVSGECLPAGSVVSQNASKYRVQGGVVEDAPFPERAEGEGKWFGYAVIRFVADNPGVWLMHCHITFHLEAGLAITFVEAIEEIERMEQPAIVQETCDALKRYEAVGGTF
ncbi:Cupredoxin [Chytriomyces sp. MP71]|nr:Cupredoxin [Chytriomyces sp. MP71]